MRDSLGLKEGDSVEFHLRPGEIVLRKLERKTILALGGIARDRKIRGGRPRRKTVGKVMRDCKTRG
jgi:bifunctional DNA-binding transcriptional regulator/antitoxin component of YhaV-PrlF toxin-antitoxin module